MSRTVLLRDSDGGESPILGHAVLQPDEPGQPLYFNCRLGFFVPGGIEEGQETYRRTVPEYVPDDAVTG